MVKGQHPWAVLLGNMYTLDADVVVKTRIISVIAHVPVVDSQTPK